MGLITKLLLHSIHISKDELVKDTRWIILEVDLTVFHRYN